MNNNNIKSQLSYPDATRGRFQWRCSIERLLQTLVGVVGGWVKW